MSVRIRAGDFDRVFSLQHNIADLECDEPDNWEIVDSIRGKLLPMSGTERWIPNQVTAEADYNATIRWRTDIDESLTWRIVIGSKIYDIISVFEIGRKQGLNLALKHTTGDTVTS